MKKLLSIILVLTMCLGLCSCSFLENVTAASLYAKAVKTLSEAENYEADCKMTMGIGILGINMDMTFDINMKLAGKNMQVYMNILEQEVISTYLDGFMYVDILGQSIKYSVDETTIVEEELMSESISTNIPEIAADILEATEVIENEDGTKELSVALTDEQSEKLLGVATAMYTEMTFENTVFTLKFDADNNFTGMSIKSDYVANDAGLEMTGDVEAEYQFINIGEIPEILLPNDAASYTDGGRYEDSNNSLI